MPIKTILLVMAFVFACGGALFVPLIGVLGYMLHYHVSPETQWWGQPIAHWGIRYSFLLGAFTGVATIIGHANLRYGRTFFSRLEWLCLLFLGWVWALTIMHPTVGTFLGADTPPVKLAKMLVFAIILTHVVTDQKAVNWVLWILVVGTLYVGHQANNAPYYMYITGRLDGVGGPDFREANGLAAHLAACLPIVGIQFLRSKWKGKILCAVAGVLAVNGIVLTRSRGGLVGLAAGMAVALLTIPKRNRKTIVAGLIVAALGSYALMDDSFLQRAETITAEEEERDGSAQARLNVWSASVEMLKDHPEGVGPGNFAISIGAYASVLENRDAHSTFVLCYSELGIPGLVLLLVIIAGTYRTLFRVRRQALSIQESHGQDLHLVCYGLIISLTVYLGAGLTVSRLYSEGFWWFLMMPICLARTMDNLPSSRPDELEISLELERPGRDRRTRRPAPRRAEKVLGGV